MVLAGASGLECGFASKISGLRFRVGVDLIFGVLLEQLAVPGVATDFIREVAFTRQNAADCVCTG